MGVTKHDLTVFRSFGLLSFGLHSSFIIRHSNLIVLLLLMVGVGRAGRAAELNEGLPQDALGFVELNPAGVGGAKGAGNGSGGGLLGMGMDAMQSFGVLPKEAGEVSDALGLAAVAGDHRSCVALLDADLGAGDNGALVFKSAQVAWVIDTGGRAEEARGMVERLARVLDHLSTRETVRQTVKKTAEEKREYVEFRDTRWPAWLVLAWTTREKEFVVTLGAGAMEHYLADRAVGGVPWTETVAAADAEALRVRKVKEGGEVLARVYFREKALRERFPEAMNKTILGKLTTSLEMQGADAGMVVARLRGREISLDQATVTGGKVQVNPWTENLGLDSPLLKAVPAEAEHYLAMRMDWGKLYDRVTAIYDAVQKPGQDPMEKQVADFAKGQGVEVRRDILSKMAPVVLVHDWPEHPLKLPLMVTVMGAADGEAKQAMEKLLATAGAELDAKSRAKSGGVSEMMRFRLRRDADGVTYMQFGLVGPAWGWEGNRWVFSWSPAAVRYNLPGVKGVSEGAFSAGSPKGDH